MTVDFEGTQYQSLTTSPYIPYAVYVHENHLLLVPRAVEKVHPAFPARQGQDQRHFTLQLSDWAVSTYQGRFGQAPKFEGRRVDFGFEEDEGVVVCALLPGSDLIPYWSFATMLRGEETVIRKHFMDLTSDPEDGYGIMLWDLKAQAT
ncbi:hypothetical protein GGR56DRAFT_287835 [Xylariaceae sp. FL0804]|nr:hypothetical protein GGR56DRAFT_287835 [Xylariaceae sp. FL0804]